MRDVLAEQPVLTSSSERKEYHVAPDGDDRGSGSALEPWKTISRGIAALGPGITITVHGGSYAEQVTIDRSGCEGMPAVLIAASGERVVIDGTNVPLHPPPMRDLPEDESVSEASFRSSWPGAPIAADARFAGLIQIVGAHDVDVEGIVVTNAGQSENHAGVFVRNSVRVGVRRLRTYNTRSSGIGVWRCRDVSVEGNEVVLACNDGPQECITIAGTYGFRVEGNRVHHGGPGTFGGEGIDIKQGSKFGKVISNRVHDNRRLGIYIEARDRETRDILISGNATYRNHADGVTLASEMGGLLHDVVVQNNAVFQNRLSGIVVGRYGDVPNQPIKGISLVNNTVARNGFPDSGGGVWIENEDVSSVEVRDNTFADNGAFQIALADNIPVSAVSVANNWIYGFRDRKGESPPTMPPGGPKLSAIGRGSLRPTVAVGVSGRAQGSESKTMFWDTYERTYRIQRPPTREDGPPIPVVIFLHGLDSNKDRIAFDDLSEQVGCLVVYPESLPADGVAWNVGDGTNEHADDVGFLNVLIDTLILDEDADPQRIYVAGYSRGASMAYAFRSKIGGRIAAIAAVSGLCPVSAVEGLLTDPTTPIAHFHCDADRECPAIGTPDCVSADGLIHRYAQERHCNLVIRDVAELYSRERGNDASRKIGATDSDSCLLVWLRGEEDGLSWPPVPHQSNVAEAVWALFEYKRLPTTNEG